VVVYLCGVPPAYRLPLRAYHAALFFKNGVPIGYFEGLSLFERMEAGFNLYYTFREGETAWLYARLLRLFNQLLGVTCFSVDPYQIGSHNQEAIASGAFWFYRKLGFRPVEPEQARLAASEETKIRVRPGYRTPARVLRRLAGSSMIYEAPGTARGDWDSFQVRKLGFMVARRMAEEFGGDAGKLRRTAVAEVSRVLGFAPGSWKVCERVALTHLAPVVALIPGLRQWPSSDKDLVVRIMRAKAGADESAYLKLLQRHPRLRKAFLRLGA
jgi:hypothetical protein